MRILYFTRSWSPHDHRFLSLLAGSGHEVGYLAYEAEAARSAPPELPDGVRALKWEGVQHAWALAHNRRALKRVLAEFKPDLVHAGPVQHGAFLTALAGFSPLLTMSWGSDMLLGARGGIGRRQAGYTLQRSTLFLCDCQAVREHAVALGMDEERIVVFPWGVDLGHFSPGEGVELREGLGWGDAFVLLSTRSMEPLYAVDVTVDAFIRAAEKNAALRLLLLGDGSMREGLAAALREAGLEDRVHFAGPVGLKELPEYYRAADLYLSSSTSDGSSISLLEAMASGLPAAVSDIPGNREWVTHGENGWLFPAGNAQALAEAILHASGSIPEDSPGVALAAPGDSPASLLRQYALMNRAICEQRADWRINSRKLLDAYEVALGHPVRHPGRDAGRQGAE